MNHTPTFTHTHKLTHTYKLTRTHYRLLLHTSADWDDGGLINLARKKQTAIRALPREDGYVTSFTLGKC